MPTDRDGRMAPVSRQRASDALPVVDARADRFTRALLVCGVVAGPLFVTVIADRPGPATASTPCATRSAR